MCEKHTLSLDQIETLLLFSDTRLPPEDKESLEYQITYDTVTNPLWCSRLFEIQYREEQDRLRLFMQQLSLQRQNDIPKPLAPKIPKVFKSIKRLERLKRKPYLRSSGRVSPDFKNLEHYQCPCPACPERHYRGFKYHGDSKEYCCNCKTLHYTLEPCIIINKL